MRKADPPGQREADQGEIRSCTNSRSIQIRESELPVARRKIAGILCVFQDFSTRPAAILAVKLGAEAIGTASYSQKTVEISRRTVYNGGNRICKSPPPAGGKALRTRERVCFYAPHDLDCGGRQEHRRPAPALPGEGGHGLPRGRGRAGGTGEIPAGPARPGAAGHHAARHGRLGGVQKIGRRPRPHYHAHRQGRAGGQGERPGDGGGRLHHQSPSTLWN